MSELPEKFSSFSLIQSQESLHKSTSKDGSYDEVCTAINFTRMQFSALENEGDKAHLSLLHHVKTDNRIEKTRRLKEFISKIDSFIEIKSISEEEHKVVSDFIKKCCLPMVDKAKEIVF